MPSIDVLIGGCLVWLAARERFNTPSTNRSSTTAIRYHSAAITYYALLLSVYGLIATSPEPVTLLKTIAPNMPPESSSASPPMIAAFALGALLPRIPAFATIDASCRRWLQGMAAIPTEVRRLAAEIRGASFNPGEALRRQTAVFVNTLGLSPSDLDFAQGHGPRNVWTKLTVLRVVMDQWEEDRKFSGFLVDFRSDLDEMKARYARLASKAKLALQMATSPNGGSSQESAPAATAYLSEFRDQCTECLHVMMTLLSRALLKSDLTQNARLSDLRSMGFSLEAIGGGIAPDELILVTLCVWLIALVGFVAIPGVAANTKIDELLARTVMIAVIYGMAVASAIYEREHRSRRHRSGEVPPLGRYLLVSAVASVLGLVISLWFHALILEGLQSAWARLTVVYPWFGLTFVTTFMTAICLDNAPTERIGGRRLRLIESGAMALVMMIVARGVHAWLDQRLGDLPDPSGYKVPPVVGVMVISGSMGAFIGWCVPTLYRRTTGRLAQSRPMPIENTSSEVPILPLGDQSESGNLSGERILSDVAGSPPGTDRRDLHS